MVQTKTALLLGYRCNNNCRFCYAADKKGRFQAMGTEEVKRQLDRGLERGSTYVDFLGGEPTIRKDIIELVQYASDNGYETISMTTNGRMFSKKDFAKKIVEAGLNSAVFSIHGHNAELHDYLSGVRGAYAQTINGLANFRAAAPDAYICINTVIMRPNLEHLPKLAENNVKHKIDAMEFIFPHPRGNIVENFEELVPRLEELIDMIQKVITVGIKNGIKHTFMRYVPFCYMLGSTIYISEHIEKGNLAEQHIGPEFEDLAVEENRAKNGRVHGPQCYGCKYGNVCEGIFKEYAERRGFEELVPVP